MAHVSDLIATDIGEYLQQHEHKGLLRFITCGSVDDGKSTLIGRLLYDTKMLFEDQLAAMESDSRKWGTQGGDIDCALLDTQVSLLQGFAFALFYCFAGLALARLAGQRHEAGREFQLHLVDDDVVAYVKAAQHLAADQ